MTAFFLLSSYSLEARLPWSLIMEPVKHTSHRTTARETHVRRAERHHKNGLHSCRDKINCRSPTGERVPYRCRRNNNNAEAGTDPDPESNR